jgi:hypothetical protein
MSDYFQVIAHYQVKAGEIEAVAELLRQLADASRQEPGNLAYDYFQDFSDPSPTWSFLSATSARNTSRNTARALTSVPLGWSRSSHGLSRAGWKPIRPRLPDPQHPLDTTADGPADSRPTKHTL